MGKVLVNIKITKEENLEARRLAKERSIPFIDCLNAVQARNYKAIIISQDEHYTKNLKDIVKTVKPENIS